MTDTLPSYWPPQPLTLAERRGSLTAAARIRHRHPTAACVLVSLDAPAVPDDDRWDWLDRLAYLAGHLDALATVGSSDDARRVAEQWDEGPWTADVVLADAKVRHDEVNAEIDDMVREAQA